MDKLFPSSLSLTFKLIFHSIRVEKVRSAALCLLKRGGFLQVVRLYRLRLIRATAALQEKEKRFKNLLSLQVCLASSWKNCTQKSASEKSEHRWTARVK